MKKLIVLLAVLAATTAQAQNRIRTENLRAYTRDWTDDEVINLWYEMDTICRENITGEIIPACINRTELGAILNRRGLCQSVVPSSYNEWQQCLVRRTY